MKKLSLSILVTMLTFLVSITNALAGTVYVEISEINEIKGKISIGLYSNAETFPTSGKEFKGKMAEVTGTTVIYTFKDIPSGVYAVAIYHDSNSNGKLDKNFLGIPKENYAFSNNASGTFGPPDFKDAAFILEDSKTIMNLKHTDQSYRKLTNGRQLILNIGASVLSGVLIALSMPNSDLSFLAWFGLVPLLFAIALMPEKSPILPVLMATPCGIVWSVFVHIWYPGMFGAALGGFLILLVGWWYANLIGWGVALQRKLPGALKVLAIPVVWSALEFVKYIAPGVENWWFILLAKSQWRFPPALQVLSITGFPGLSFIIILTNVALASLLLKAFQKRRADQTSVIALACVAGIVGWGALTIPEPPSQTFTIAATVDMTNQDEAVQSLGKSYTKSETGMLIEGPYADTPEMSQAIFDINAQLTRSVASQQPAFIVWPENEFSDADDKRFIGQLGQLALELNTYIVADTVWRAPTGMHDTALLVGPDGNEKGRRAKIAVTDGEADHGFVPGPEDFPIIDTPHGKVGIGVCWDRHRLWIVRELARAGAQIVLMPADDDFNHNRQFPAFHASDAVFRAVENRVVFGLGTTNGISIVINPYGQISAESGVNTRTIITGNVFTTSERTLYTHWGDWFGWLMVICLALLVILVKLNQRKRQSV